MGISKKNVQSIRKRVLSWEQRSSFLILLLASVVGVLTGIVGLLFQICINYIINWHKYFLNDTFRFSYYLDYFLIFIIAAIMGAFSYYLVKRYAPESSGSGIPEVEGALIDLRPIRWWRVIPVKFFGGLAAIGSGMILGREGPTVQIGANLGKMVSHICKLKSKEAQHILIATGAGSGITTAFNAPLGGILFVIEEMREEFSYTKTSIQAVFVGCVAACITYYFIMSSTLELQLKSGDFSRC